MSLKLICINQNPYQVGSETPYLPHSEFFPVFCPQIANQCKLEDSENAHTRMPFDEQLAGKERGLLPSQVRDKPRY